MQILSKVASQEEKEWERQEKGNTEEGGYNLTVVKHRGTKRKVKKHNAKKPTTKKPQMPHLIFPSPQ